MEVGFTDKVLDGRPGYRMAEQGFRKEENECCARLVRNGTFAKASFALTLAELTIHLSAKDVKEVGWGSHIRYLHVAILMLTFQGLGRGENARVFVAKLKVSLHSA